MSGEIRHACLVFRQNATNFAAAHGALICQQRLASHERRGGHHTGFCTHLIEHALPIVHACHCGRRSLGRIRIDWRLAHLGVRHHTQNPVAQFALQSVNDRHHDNQ